MKTTAAAFTLALLPMVAVAKPVTYTVDPDHTYPSFEAPHIQGISIWRGKIDHSAGTIVLDREAKTGSVDITMQADSVDFGHPVLNEHARTHADLFDAEKYPTITYKASTIKFNGDSPSEIDGQLTMHGVTKPVVLKINSFKCIMHPMLKKEVCGADASADLNRADFGIDAVVKFTGSPMVKLAIQVEGIKND